MGMGGCESRIFSHHWGLALLEGSGGGIPGSGALGGGATWEVMWELGFRSWAWRRLQVSLGGVGTRGLSKVRVGVLIKEAGRVGRDQVVEGLEPA